MTAHQEQQSGRHTAAPQSWHQPPGPLLANHTHTAAPSVLPASTVSPTPPATSLGRPALTPPGHLARSPSRSLERPGLPAARTAVDAHRGSATARINKQPLPPDSLTPPRPPASPTAPGGPAAPITTVDSPGANPVR